MSTKTVNIHEAKTHLSELLALALQGEEVVIAKANKPLVRLVPIEAAPQKRRFGARRGEIWAAENFDAPLPAEFWTGSDAA